MFSHESLATQVFDASQYQLCPYYTFRTICLPCTFRYPTFCRNCSFIGPTCPLHTLPPVVCPLHTLPPIETISYACNDPVIDLGVIKAQLLEQLKLIEAQERVAAEASKPQTLEEANALERDLTARLEAVKAQKAALSSGGQKK